MKVELTLQRYEEMRDRITQLEIMIKQLQECSGVNLCIERSIWAGTEIRVLNSDVIIERLKADADSDRDRAESIMNYVPPLFNFGRKSVRELKSI